MYNTRVYKKYETLKQNQNQNNKSHFDLLIDIFNMVLNELYEIKKYTIRDVQSLNKINDEIDLLTYNKQTYINQNSNGQQGEQLNDYFASEIQHFKNIIKRLHDSDIIC
jgi:hypothetical protein